MTFRVGMKVVCIKRGHWTNTRRGDLLPTSGGIYTIRKIIDLDDGAHFHLDEIVNRPDRNGIEPCFYSRRFRPIVSRKTDISFAHEILRSASHKETA